MLDKKKFYINGQWVDSKNKEEINEPAVVASPVITGRTAPF